MLTNDRYLIECYEQTERFFWSNISIETAQINGTEVFASGANNLYLNSAIQRKPLTEATLQPIMDTLQAFYKPFNLPWVWIIREDLIPSSLIIPQSLQLLDKSIVMALDLKLSLPHQAANNLFITENNDDLTDWGICLSKAYQIPEHTTDQYSEGIQKYIAAHMKETSGKSKFHHFVGYLNDIPVSCVTLSFQNAVARIDDVGTVPEHQHKGYATQILLHTLQHSTTIGADICFLESSQAGIKVYSKLGFEALYSNLYFEVVENIMGKS